MGDGQRMQEGEIDIKEYIKIAIKRKNLVLAVCLISVIFTAIASLRTPRFYESTATIQLGSINGLLIKNEDAKAMILNQNYLLSVINGLNFKITSEGLQQNIKISDVSGTNLLKIQIINSSPDDVLKINDAVVKPFIAQGQMAYQKRLSIIDERLEELDGEIKSAEEDIKRAKNLISGISDIDGISQSEAFLRIILLQNVLPNHESNLSALKDRRNGLKLILADAKDFMIFDAPLKPKYLEGPKKRQNILISGIMGLIGGVFLSFLLEFWQKNGRRN